MNDNNPFEFGVVVSGKFFTNRKTERERLARNFGNNINTILISPRRWGKSSLVKEVAIDMAKRNPNIRFCFVDLFNIRTEHEFYESLVSAIVNATADKLDEAKLMLKSAFKMLVPKLSLSIGPVEEFSVALELKELKRNADEILNFAEKIAAKKKIKLIVCIDEFQNLEFFNEELAFQKKLRAHWQHHHNATYCLYGSKRHMMINIFNKSSMPFYRFGDIMFLEKIATPDFEKFILNNFTRTGKQITPELCITIIDKMKNHPYYVQQLAHLVWNNSDKKVTNGIIDIAVKDLLNQNAIFYQREADNLSNTQIGLLKAIVDEVETLSSASVMHEYGVGTSANVKKNKLALEKKEILDLYSGPPKFLDPAFEIWFKLNFTNRSY